MRTDRDWWKIFSIRKVFSPILTESSVVRNDYRMLGFTDFYFFGFRVARITRVHPWIKYDL